MHYNQGIFRGVRIVPEMNLILERYALKRIKVHKFDRYVLEDMKLAFYLNWPQHTEKTQTTIKNS